MEVTVYQLTFTGDPSGLLHFSLEPHSPNCEFRVGNPGQEAVYRADTSVSWLITAPTSSRLERDSETGMMMLVWNGDGREFHSQANTAFALAHSNFRGFGNLRRA
jgi:hypothetical protein